MNCTIYLDFFFFYIGIIFFSMNNKIFLVYTVYQLLHIIFVKILTKSLLRMKHHGATDASQQLARPFSITGNPAPLPTYIFHGIDIVKTKERKKQPYDSQFANCNATTCFAIIISRFGLLISYYKQPLRKELFMKSDIIFS